MNEKDLLLLKENLILQLDIFCKNYETKTNLKNLIIMDSPKELEIQSAYQEIFSPIKTIPKSKRISSNNEKNIKHEKGNRNQLKFSKFHY